MTGRRRATSNPLEHLIYRSYLVFSYSEPRWTILGTSFALRGSGFNPLLAAAPRMPSFVHGLKVSVSCWGFIRSGDPRLGDMGLEKPVHGLCAGRQDRSQFAPVDHLGGPRARVPCYPRNLFHRDSRAGHQ
jgi:hypothetical protein